MIKRPFNLFSSIFSLVVGIALIFMGNMDANIGGNPTVIYILAVIDLAFSALNGAIAFL